jgi:3-deoxy-7-phosphoheptulonate synthase
MIIVMKAKATEKEISFVIAKIESLGLEPHVSKGVERTIIGAIGDERLIKKEQLRVFSGVENVIPILKPYKLVSKEFKQEPTIIKVNDVEIGGKEIIVMAGPCAVENEEQIVSTAFKVKEAGAKILRGGAFKPRTDPYAFQGLGEDGLKLSLWIHPKLS